VISDLLPVDHEPVASRARAWRSAVDSAP